jgi:EAL domain-containing protein (putative c-di-GMP-specific phosphodiesterase class I)
LVSVADRRIVGVEALMRWKHPSRTWVSPAVFIPIAEHSGQILELGEWALHEACQQLKVWSSKVGGMRMSVNVSAGQFLHTDFPVIVDRALSESGLRSGQLVLELTESVLVENLEVVADILTRLQAVGVQVAIDDFGTGYSSLSYLSRLPIDCLKIDRSFVQRYSEDKYDAEIVRAVISLGHALDMKVLAEGVETSDQLEFLAELGCHEAQGYYFSKPLPAADLSEAIARNAQWPTK